jgi:16S rRNA (guanine(966)-N(2))-methyltransferase RsmD
MRVISGRAKGRRLKSVPGGGTRPITDRAKTSLFNILGHQVINSRFLDLFAGTGSVGIEALSRGAAQVVFVERSGLALRTIRENLTKTDLANGERIERADVFTFLEHSPEPFDYVYIAPPQYKGLWVDTLQAIDQAPGWLYDDGWAIAQLDPREFEALSLQRLSLFDQRTYGSVMLCFYQKKLKICQS